jgi:hypothetical protein
MSRPKELSQLLRPHRVQVRLDHQLMDDISRIADSWNVPPSTVAYWLLRGLMADARGDTFVMAGDSLSERLGHYLVRKFQNKKESPHG